MISVKEAINLGCEGFLEDGSTNSSCLVWMYNYLTGSINYG